MASISTLRPSSVAALTDAEGRELLTLPAEVAHALLIFDSYLGDHGMKFNIHCERCTMERRAAFGNTNVPPVLVVPEVRDGRIEFNCGCARRQSPLRERRPA